MRLSTAELFPAVPSAEVVSLEQIIESCRGEVLPLAVARELGAAVAARVGALHSSGRVLGNFDATCVRCNREGRVTLSREGGRRLAPELQRDELPTQRSDVYAVAHVIFQLLTSRTPAAAAATEDPSRLHAVPPPSRFNPAIDAELDAVVLAALQHDPSARSTNVVALQAALSATASAADSIRQVVSGLLPPALPQLRAIPSFQTLVFGRAAAPVSDLSAGPPVAPAAPTTSATAAPAVTVAAPAPDLALLPAKTLAFGLPSASVPPPTKTLAFGLPSASIPPPAKTLAFGLSSAPVQPPEPGPAKTLAFGLPSASLPETHLAGEPTVRMVAAAPAAAPAVAGRSDSVIVAGTLLPEPQPAQTTKAQRRVEALAATWLASPPVFADAESVDAPVVRERLWSSPAGIGVAVFVFVLLLGAALLTLAARSPAEPAPQPVPRSVVAPPVPPPAAIIPAATLPARPVVQPAVQVAPRAVQPAPARTPLREAVKKRRPAR